MSYMTLNPKDCYNDGLVRAAFRKKIRTLKKSKIVFFDPANYTQMGTPKLSEKELNDHLTEAKTTGFLMGRPASTLMNLMDEEKAIDFLCIIFAEMITDFRAGRY